jgi:hypothetical protein
MLMPHRVFDPSQQRVIHASITEKKRLAEVLSYIMVQRQTNPPKIGPLGKQPITTRGQWNRECGVGIMRPIDARNIAATVGKVDRHESPDHAPHCS